MRSAERPVLTAVILVMLCLFGAGAARAYYNPPSNIPPGPPPNYNQIDTLYFLGPPILPLPPPDSGGFYIWVDSSGSWNIANHIYVRGNNIEHYHGSILATMNSQPTPGINVFATNFELTGDSQPSQCYRQNDRWGWYQWDSNLYEIWWDVSTRESVPDSGDANDFMKITIVGCAIDFNVWSSGHDHGFGPDQVFLGASMTRLSEVPGFTDSYPGISDPYQSQIDFGSRNITIFTPISGNGQSYNVDGFIVPGQTYPCGPILGQSYGDRFGGAFVYEGNGIEFSAGCVFNPCEDNSAPVLLPPFVYDEFQCDLSEYCFDVNASDAEENLHHFEKLSGPGTIDPQTGTVCFTPAPGSHSYLFDIAVMDSCGLADTAEYTVNVDTNDPPSAFCPGGDDLSTCDIYLTVCDLSEICIPGFTYSDPDNNIVSVNAIGGSLHGDTICFIPVQGQNTLRLAVTDACGASDTCTAIVAVTLNRVPDAVSPPDESRLVCDLGQICIPGFHASDPDDNLVSTVLHGGTLHGDTACFTPAPGVNTLRLIATDACGAADTSITHVTVSINSPPVASSPDDTTLSLPALAPICLPGFSASDPNGNLVSTVVLGGTLSGDTVCFMPVQGINTLTLICTDACGAADTASTDVTVNLTISLAVVGGDPPEFTEEVRDSILISVSGGDPDSLAFTTDFTSHAGYPSRYSTSFNGGIFKVVITFDYLGEFSSAQSPFPFRVIAADNYSADTLFDSLTVNDNNRLPSIGSINDTSIFAGSTLAFAVTGNDPDADNTLTLAKVSGPGAFSSVPSLPPVTGYFSWSPSSGDIGEHSVIFSVDDGRGGTARDTVSITVVPSGIDLTVIGGAPPIFTEEIADSFFVSLGGYDAGSLSFSTSFEGHSGAPSRYAASLVGGHIRVVVTFDYLGEFSNANSPFPFKVIAADNYSADTLFDSLTVNDNNRDPAITVGANYTVIVDHQLSFNVSADDQDADNSLTLSKISGPGSFPGASGPPPVSAMFTWTPTDADLPNSPDSVLFAVADGRGGVDTALVVITVYPDGVPSIEIIYSPNVFQEDLLDSLVFTAHDPDGDPLGGFGYKFMAPDSTFPGASFVVRNDTAFLRLTFDFVGSWSFLGSPFPLRLLAYSLVDDADSTFLNVMLTVLNTNRKPELQVTGPHSIEAGETVNLTLTTSDPDTDDNLSLSAANLPSGSIFSDLGDGHGSFSWMTSSPDIGSYSLRFDANDNRGQSNSMDTVIWSLQVTSPDTGGQLGLEIGCPAALPGSDVLVPVFLHTPQVYTGGFELLIGWDPTVLTLLEAIPTARMNGGEEYFNVHMDDSGPGTARFVWIANINDGNYTPPMFPGHAEIMWLNFHVAPGDFLFGVSVPIEFLVHHYSDNTISDSTGYQLIHPPLTSGCVIIADPEMFVGDPNLNCRFFEIADAVLVARRLIEGQGVWAEDDNFGMSPDCTEDTHFFGNDLMQEIGSDLNGNGFADIADLVRFINILNGFVVPPKLDPTAGVAVITVPEEASAAMEIRINSSLEIGGALVRLDYSDVEFGAPVAPPGMEILSHDFQGVLSVLVYSLAGSRIPTGDNILFTLPASGDGRISIAEVSAADSYGRLIEITSRIEAPLPTETSLSQNYPNPFNSSTRVSLALAEAGDVELSIYDITGRKIRVLLNGPLDAGYHSIVWDGLTDRGEAVSSGIYFARMRQNGLQKTIKMSLLK